MRALYLSAFFSFLVFSAQAQKEDDEEYLSSVKGPTCKDLHFGLTIGFNHHGIIAGQIEYVNQSGFAFDYNVGLGGWGIKQGVTAKYYFGECGLGWQIGAGISYSGRQGEGQAELMVVDSLGVEKNEGVTIRLYPITSAKIFGGHYWKLGEKMRMHLVFGFEGIISNKSYEILSNHILSDSQKIAFEWLKPGGLTIALGFTI